MKMMNHDIPSYMRMYVPESTCNDRTILGRQFYSAKARELFELMLHLAKKNVTIYPKKLYKARTLA
jgi:hypothetical protein